MDTPVPESPMAPPDASAAPRQRHALHTLLKAMVDRKASDLHLTVNAPPLLRVDGAIVRLHMPELTSAETKQLAYSVLTDSQKHEFEERRELDCSFGVKGLARFRMNCYLQRGAVCAVFRTIPRVIPTIEELGLPSLVTDLTQRPQGLVLVTGPTGSGKSTTLAAMIDCINNERAAVIVTIEDPIEYLHVHRRSIINQREVRTDTENFKAALRHVLRQDPNVILIGEMRDLETMEAALTISETGHLTFATLHTNSAVQSITRIVDAFPAQHQDQVRTELSFVLEAVISQRLVPRTDGRGRALACEVLIPNEGIRNLVRENKIHQVYSMMQTGQSVSGMQTMNQSLAALCARGTVAPDVALRCSPNYRELEQMLTEAQRTRGR